MGRSLWNWRGRLLVLIVAFAAVGASIAGPRRVMRVAQMISSQIQERGSALLRFAQEPLFSAPIVSGTVITPIPQASTPATGPLRVHPDNPRYFSDPSGRAIWLTGAHTWSNLQDYGTTDPPPPFEYQAYLEFLQQHNHNFFRLWAWEQAKWTAELPGEFWNAPMPYARTGPGLALDGKPKYDLSKLNQAYFDRLRERVIQAGDRGIYVSIMLFNGWSIEDKDLGQGNPWPGHPFHADNNINGIDGDSNNDGEGHEIHTLANPAIVALQEQYLRKLLDTVNDLDNVLFEISNESHGESQAWQAHMIDYIKSYEATLPQQHPVGMTVEYPGGSNAELFASAADWISPNAAIAGELPVADGRKVILIDTDHLCGICGEYADVWKYFTRGFNFLFMDPYDEAGVARGIGPGSGRQPDDPVWVAIRRNMGYARSYASRMNLAAMTPRGDLASSGYCLANPNQSGAEYLVYLPSGSVSVDISGAAGELAVEWLNPATGEQIIGATTIGGDSRTFIAPFNGDAVLYIHQEAPAPSPTAASPSPTAPASSPTSQVRPGNFLPMLGS